MPAYYLWHTMEPPINGQVGAGAFVSYSEVSFIGRLYHIRLRTLPLASTQALLFLFFITIVQNTVLIGGITLERNRGRVRKKESLYREVA